MIIKVDRTSSSNQSFELAISSNKKRERATKTASGSSPRGA